MLFCTFKTFQSLTRYVITFEVLASPKPRLPLSKVGVITNTWWNVTIYKTNPQRVPSFQMPWRAYILCMCIWAYVRVYACVWEHYPCSGSLLVAQLPFVHYFELYFAVLSARWALTAILTHLMNFMHLSEALRPAPPRPIWSCICTCAFLNYLIEITNCNWTCVICTDRLLLIAA